MAFQNNKFRGVILEGESNWMLCMIKCVVIINEKES